MGVLVDAIQKSTVFRTLRAISFRLVLRHYFGAKLEPLPDECYWSALGDPFEFTDITDDVRPMARVSR